MYKQKTRSGMLTMPAAVIIAGAMIAIAIIWIKKPATTPVAENKPNTEEISMRPVDSTDHILGNPNATIKIVEYSDSSCPACKMFNPIMEQIMDEYGPTGKVAWVYRYFPLDKPGSRSDGGILHPNAGYEAQALECSASIGGNDKFWAFEKRLYEITPSVTVNAPNGLDRKKLPEIAKYIGLDVNSFNDCLSSEKFKDKVEADFNDGLNAGVSGTPYSVIITPSGSKIPMNGAQPYSTVKNVIDALLTEK